LLWCFVFLAGQICGATLALLVVVGAYALGAPQPGKFILDELDGFVKAVDPKAQGDRPPVPFAFGQALAWGMLAAQFISLGLIALVLPRRIGSDWKRQLGVHRPHWLHVLLVLLILPGFMVLPDLVQTVVDSVTGLKPQPMAKVLNSVFAQFPWPLTILAVGIGPGVVEELWCRGFLGRGLCSRYGLVAGVILTSSLFALMHVEPRLLPVIVLMGAYLHFTYLATRSIWVPILLHAMNNGFAVLLALTLKQPDPDDVKAVPLVVYLVAFSLMIFGSVALWTSRAQLEPVLRENDAWWEDSGWKPEYPGISAPPVEANMRLSYAVVSPVAVIFTVVSFGVLMYLGYRYLI
jgi:membrane protease YdiL (CAAX protease family)